MNKLLVPLAVFTLMASCRASEFYTLRELKTQKVPDNLKNTTWTLTNIDGQREPTKTIAAEFQDNSICPFDFQFADEGRLLMTFKGRQLKGTYVIDGDRFKYINCGWREKIVWNLNPECKITPTELAYIFVGEFQFSMADGKMTLINSSGDSFELSARK